MGVGGGFIMIPAMIYLLRMPTNVVIGTSFFQIVCVAALTGVMHSVENQAVDIVLGFLLVVGGVIGAQYGVRAAEKMPAEQLRALLAAILLLIGARRHCSLRFLLSRRLRAQTSSSPTSPNTRLRSARTSRARRSFSSVPWKRHGPARARSTATSSWWFKDRRGQ